MDRILQVSPLAARWGKKTAYEEGSLSKVAVLAGRWFSFLRHFRSRDTGITPTKDWNLT
jgi:hypothetical protein